MTVEHLPPTSLTPCPENPRKITESAVGLVAESIHKYGFLQPIVADAENVVVVGHTRLRAAQKLGLDLVPVVRASDLTPQQIREYRLVDNRLSEATEWDEHALAAILSDLRSRFPGSLRTTSGSIGSSWKRTRPRCRSSSRRSLDRTT